MSNLPNVILVVLDTARYDSIYPVNENNRIPFLRDFSKECVVFHNAISPASWTIPAHASIFTGLYPSRHGVKERVNGEIPNYSEIFQKYEGDTIAESLCKLGYRTIGFSQNILIAPDTSFSRGFNEFYYTHNPNQDTYFRMLENYSNMVKKYGSSPKEVLPKLKSPKAIRDFLSLYKSVKRDTRWLNNNDLRDKGGNIVLKRVEELNTREPFFLFINFMEMHDPHDNISLNIGWPDSFFRSKPVPESDVEKVRESYLKSTETVDSMLKELIRILKEKGTFENSIIILTSDHGQGLMEHENFFGHGTFLYDELIRVPLIIRMPHGAKFSVNQGFQSTTKLKSFIENSINYDNYFDSITEEFVFSECFGSLDKEITKFSSHPRYKEILARIDRSRKAIYFKNSKLVIDVDNETIEEILSFSGHKLEVNDAVVKEMTEIMDIFNWNSR